MPCERQFRVPPGWPCPVVVQVIIAEAAVPEGHVVAAVAAVAAVVAVVDAVVVVDPDYSLVGTDRSIEGMDT